MSGRKVIHSCCESACVGKKTTIQVFIMNILLLRCANCELITSYPQMLSMKHTTRFFFPLALLTTALACNQNEKNNAPPSPPQSTVRQDRSTAPSAAEADAFQQAEEQSESPRDAAFSTAVARDNFPDSTKRFVRTADIRFLTKDVLKATLALLADLVLRLYILQ
jgi:hypothetical protein